MDSKNDLERKSLEFLEQHLVGNKPAFLTGNFSLYKNSQKSDLYGTIDALYIFYTLGLLNEVTNRESRELWANRILLCQDDSGWFTKDNLRGHSKEHSTAYAIGALKLLEITKTENYLVKIKPLNEIKPLLKDYASFTRWISSLDYRPSIGSIARKNLGWHYIWRGSHVGGGIAAIIGMAEQLMFDWWQDDQIVSASNWFSWYFDWLNQRINHKTGLWQRAFWNSIYKTPTVMEMGGAVHFYWIYSKMNQSFPFPLQLIETVIRLQQSDGLYKDHPYCIDLDANYCIIRSFNQLTHKQQESIYERVHKSINKNYEQIVNILTDTPLDLIYKDSHGLPGALAALVECDKLPGFKHSKDLVGWKHPLDKAWWL